MKTYTHTSRFLNLHSIKEMVMLFVHFQPFFYVHVVQTHLGTESVCLCAPTDISSGFHYYNKHLYRVYYGIKEMDFFW